MSVAQATKANAVNGDARIKSLIALIDVLIVLVADEMPSSPRACRPRA